MRHSLRDLLRWNGGEHARDSDDVNRLESGTKATLSLEALLLDYEMARDDDRTVMNVQAGLYGVAIALIALMVGALTQECSFGMKPTDCTNVPDTILAAAPILPLGLIAFIQSIGSVSTIRSYYMRGLEVEISRYTSRPMTALGDLRPVSYVGLTTEFASLRRGGLANRILFNVILLAILIVFGGMTLYIGIAVSSPYQVAMVLLYGTALVVLVTQTVAAVLHGPQLFQSVAQRFVRGPGYAGLPHIHADGAPVAVALQERPQQRSFFSYLLLPRPEDVVKWTIAPLTYAAFAWSVGGWAHWHRFLAVWLVLEYLVYMARYQWNDVRGAVDDREHSESRARGRLPISRDAAESRTNILVSMSVSALRLVLAMLVAWSTGFTGEAAAIIGAVFGVAAVYELLRSRTAAGLTLSTISIWLLVGAGYAIRAAVGISGAEISLLSRPALVGMGFFITFGIMFVLLTWVLDASSYGRVAADGTWSFRPALQRKPHLAGLLRFAPSMSPVTVWRDEPVALAEYGGGRRVLADGPGQPLLHAPWNIGQVAAAAAGAVLGLELAGPADRRPVFYLTALSCCVLLAVLLQQIRAKWINGLTVVAGAALLVAVARTADSVLPALSAAPWLTVSLTYLSFRNSSYRELKSFGSMVAGALRKIPGLLLRGVVGTVTWERMLKPPG